jgi:hypothetical protein
VLRRLQPPPALASTTLSRLTGLCCSPFAARRRSTAGHVHAAPQAVAPPSPPSSCVSRRTLVVGVCRTSRTHTEVASVESSAEALCDLRGQQRDCPGARESRAWSNTPACGVLPQVWPRVPRRAQRCVASRHQGAERPRRMVPWAEPHPTSSRRTSCARGRRSRGSEG